MKDKKQGTVSRLRAAFIAATVLVSAFSGAAYAQELQAPSAGITQTAPVCQLDIKELTRQLVERDFPGESAIFFVAAYNDIQCEVPEDMANVAVVVKRAEGETLFGIFHIHSRHKANILTTAVSFNDDMRWTPLTKETDWKAPWCDIIKNVYEEGNQVEPCGEFWANAFRRSGMAPPRVLPYLMPTTTSIHIESQSRKQGDRHEETAECLGGNRHVGRRELGRQRVHLPRLNR
jgi:hypothetical protein